MLLRSELLCSYPRSCLHLPPQRPPSARWLDRMEWKGLGYALPSLALRTEGGAWPPVPACRCRDPPHSAACPLTSTGTAWFPLTLPGFVAMGHGRCPSCPCGNNLWARHSAGLAHSRASFSAVFTAVSFSLSCFFMNFFG